MTRTYAILGATGNAGQMILTVLKDRTDVQMRAFVRSKSKLETLSPQLCKSSQLQIYEGTIDQLDTLEQCLAGVDAVFMVVAASKNEAGCRIAQDQAESVVAVLQRLKDHQSPLPMLVVFSSGEADDKFYYDVPWPMRSILYAANYFIYEDLKAAEKYIRTHAWVRAVFLKSGGISFDTPKGYAISEERSQTFVSWPDVAAAMVQLADEGEKWAGKNVSVISDEKAKPEISNLPLLLKGLEVYARSFLPI